MTVYFPKSAYQLEKKSSLAGGGGTPGVTPGSDTALNPGMDG